LSYTNDSKNIPKKYKKIMDATFHSSSSTSFLLVPLPSYQHLHKQVDDILSHDYDDTNIVVHPSLHPACQ
jgi:hypothetical protein